MRKKACEWRDNIKVGHISRSNACLATQTTIMKSLEYPLPALSLSVQQCAKILHPALQGSLAKISINRTIPKALRHGPINECGLNINNLYTSQGILKLQKFHQHIGEDSITGRLLRVSLETCILEARVGRNLFDLDFERFPPLVTNCWIKHLWESTTNHSIHIVDRSSNFPQIQRVNDVFLIEIFENNNYTVSELKKIKNCCIYLQVITLSDIMTASGDSFSCTYKVERDTTRNSNQGQSNQVLLA